MAKKTTKKTTKKKPAKAAEPEDGVRRPGFEPPIPPAKKETPPAQAPRKGKTVPMKTVKCKFGGFSVGATLASIGIDIPTAELSLSLVREQFIDSQHEVTLKCDPNVAEDPGQQTLLDEVVEVSGVGNTGASVGLKKAGYHVGLSFPKGECNFAEFAKLAGSHGEFTFQRLGSASKGAPE